MRNNRAVILVFIANLSHAQDATPSERELIQQLVQQVTLLQEKVKFLESQQQRADAPSTADATPQPASAAAPQAADNKSAARSSISDRKTGGATVRYDTEIPVFHSAQAV